MYCKSPAEGLRVLEAIDSPYVSKQTQVELFARFLWLFTSLKGLTFCDLIIIEFVIISDSLFELCVKI